VIRGLSSCAAAVFVATAVTAAAQTTTPQEATSVDPALIDLGKTTYAEKCSHCHGPGMLNPGTITPDLRKFPDDKERFFAIVKQGRNNKMPPWADLLSDDQIGTLWVYISSRRKP
jgi:cytochrome c55X